MMDKDKEVFPQDYKLNSFDKLIELVGDNGWRNYLIFVAASITAMISAFPAFSYQFLGATPDHWCHVGELTAQNWTAEQIKNIAIPFQESNGDRKYADCEMYDLNYADLATMAYEDASAAVRTGSLVRNATLDCHSRDFEDHVATIVNTWDLVCGRRFLYSTTSSAVQFGQLISSFVGGYLIDSFGRAFMYRIYVILLITSSFATAASPNIYVFICFRFIVSGISMGAYMSAFVFCMEICSVRQRTAVSSLFVLPWAFGVMLVSGIAYIVRPWTLLQVALTIPSLILLLSCWIVPESPRWLIIKGRHEKALTILKAIGKSNKRELPSDEHLLQSMKHIQEMSQDTSSDTGSTLPFTTKFVNLLKDYSAPLADSKIRWQTLGIFFCWFSVSMVYYGVSLGTATLSTNDYVYIFLSGIIEVPCYLLLWPAMELWGRKWSLVIFYFMCGFSIYAVLALVVFDEKDDYSTLRLVMYLSGKFAITAAFHLLYIYTAEMYSTQMRSLVLGQSSAVARIGSMFSPFINDILGKNVAWAPAALFGGCSILASIISLSFQETSNRDLPDSVNASSENVVEKSEKVVNK